MALAVSLACGEDSSRPQQSHIHLSLRNSGRRLNDWHQSFEFKTI